MAVGRFAPGLGNDYDKLSMEKLSLYERAYLNWVYHRNRLQFGRLRRNLAGRVEFAPGVQICAKNFRLRGMGSLRLGSGSVIEYGEFPCIFDLEQGGEVVIGERVLLRCKYCSNVFTVHAGARIEVGDDAGFNGAILNAKNLIKIGKGTLLGWGVTVVDADNHDLSNTRKERILSVEIGDYVMVMANSTVLPGVKIGSHSIIGANSAVTRDIPDHCIAVGAPARVVKELDDRDLAR